MTMRTAQLFSIAALASLFLPPTLAPAQSNVVPGLDVELGLLNSGGGSTMREYGHLGTFPTGNNGFAVATTSCNPGSSQALWEAAMDADHPFIAFIALREDPGSSRLVQISDYSYVKHGFFALSSNQCGYGCAGTNGTRLGIGCSDTYGTGNNGDRFWLGPPEEIDPWLGEWNPVGSLFDGTPVDGNRSFQGNGFNAIEHRINITDADLNVPGATFWIGGYYVIEHEAESLRENNQRSTRFTATWSNAQNDWNVSTSGPEIQGTVLQRWSGATLNSNTNGNTDGRLWVAHKVSGGGASYHYEYAVHNRDNSRGVSAFRLPIGNNTVVSNAGFHDIDQNAATDWDFAVVGNEIVFSTTSNPLQWNQVYNFWFDATAPPTTASVDLVQFSGGPGANEVTVQAQGPGDTVPLTYTDVCFGTGGNQLGCTDCPCGNNAALGTLGGCLNDIGGSALLTASGVPSMTNDTMRFEVSDATPVSYGLLTSATALSPANPANPCFGSNSGRTMPTLDGLRCVDQGIRRHGVRAIDQFGSVGLTSSGWGGMSAPAGGLIAQGGFSAGQTRHYQVMYRSSPLAGCLTGQNTTQAITVTIEP